MNNKKSIIIILSLLIGIALLPFIGGFYAIGPLQFPCTYQQVQGKKVGNKLVKQMSQFSVNGIQGTNINKTTNLDCIDGNSSDPVNVTATFKMTQPQSMQTVETGVLANENITKKPNQTFKPISELVATGQNLTMRIERINALETKYSSTDGSSFRVIYHFESAVPCTAPTPPESQLDLSRCKSPTIISDLSLLQQPIKTVEIINSEVPVKN